MKNHIFKPYNTINQNEIKAVKKVLESGVLSGYQGARTKEFMGGYQVKKFEKACQKYFKVKYAIAVNSWTSGLICAFGAIGIEPGDQVITTPWTMSACAASILHWGGIPIFVDINEEDYCIDPDKIEKLINKKTKAILSVDIFGQSAKIEQINKIAKKYNIYHISDSAQSPGATRNKKYTGTMADIGGISLNKHKHIQTGEGGVIFTNNSKLANRMRLIRNHGESVVSNSSKDLVNIVGYNFRLGEIEASIGIQQLKKLKNIKEHRKKIAKRLINKISKLKGLKLPKIIPGNEHIYYLFPINLDLKILKTSRNKIVKELESAGLPKLLVGYCNLHKLPMFKRKISYGTKHFPWNTNKFLQNYNNNICPIAEKLHKKSFIGILFCNYNLKYKDIDFISNCFIRTWDRLNLNNE